LIRGHSRNGGACAFELLEVNGEDVRREPIEVASAGPPGCCGSYMTALLSMSISAGRA
jgi:hypothetical protein